MCWMDPDRSHDEHEGEEKHVVSGRIVSPPDVEPAKLLSQIDAALAERVPCRIYAPDICRAAGEMDRARFEERRFDMLWNG